MHIINPPESIKELTRLYSGERFPDGRPRVSDDILERMKAVTTEQPCTTSHMMIKANIKLIRPRSRYRRRGIDVRSRDVRIWNQGDDARSYGVPTIRWNDPLP